MLPHLLQGLLEIVLFLGKLSYSVGKLLIRIMSVFHLMVSLKLIASLSSFQILLQLAYSNLKLCYWRDLYTFVFLKLVYISSGGIQLVF